MDELSGPTCVTEEFGPLDRAIATDRLYFELGAETESLPGAELAWLPGLSASPAAVVAHRVQPAIVAAAGTGWVAAVEDRLRRLGASTARIYLDRADSLADPVLSAAGYCPRMEIAFCGLPVNGEAGTFSFTRVTSEEDWRRKLEFHRAANERPDGHPSSAEDWVAIEKARCRPGTMENYLCWWEGQPVGSIGALVCDEFVRGKNLVTLPDCRRQGVGLAMLAKVGQIARGRGRSGICVFAVAGEPGEALYRAAGLREVGVQVEWSKQLDQSGSRAPSEALEPALKDYRERGFAKLSGIFSTAEIAGFRSEAARISRIDGLFGDPSRGLVRTGGPRNDRIDPVIDVSPVFSRLAKDERMVRLASRFLEGEAQLLKDKYIVKPPGAGGYAVHQDVAYWQELGIQGKDALTIAVCIDECTQRNGAVEFVPGFNDRLLTPPGVVADPDESRLPPFELVTADPGDLLLFSGLAPHRSGPNRSQGDRRILFLTYVRDERPDMYAYYQDVRRAF